MKPEKKTDAPPSENVEEIETPTNDEVQTDEGTEPEGEDVEKQEESYYKQEYEKLQSTLQEKETLLEDKEKQIEIKDRAIQALKKKPKESVDDIDSLLEAKLAERDVKATVKTIASTPEEEKVILHHYHNSIVKTGDPETDIRRALAVANEGRIHDLLGREKADEEADDAVISSFSGGYSAPKGVRIKSQARKLVESLLPKEKHKHININ